MTLSLSRSFACLGETVTLSWRASDPRATVTIAGVAAGLPSSGSQSVRVETIRTYTASAANTCGIGPSSSITLQQQPEASGSLTAPATVTQNTSAPVSFTVVNAVSWRLSSELGNTFAAMSGGGSGTFGTQYLASRSGFDAMTLALTDQCARETLVSRSIQITTAGGGTPPVMPGGVGCCDGTRSPSCFSCADLRGCCSGHGGVCGCPR